MMVSKLEKDTQKLVAYKLITSITGTISDRARRKYEKIGSSLGEKLKNKQYLPKDSILILDLKWSDEAINWARKLNLGIEEFKQEYPEYGKILEEKISKHREVRRAYLEFGLKDENDFSSQVYLEVIKEVIPQISDEKANDFYNNLKEFNSLLKKKKKSLDTFLLPE